jgi:hypothetical protein
MGLETDRFSVEGNFFDRKPFQRDILAAEKTYAIGIANYSNPRNEVHEVARGMLGSYRIQKSFANHPERMLFTLALADSWLEEGSFTERKAFLDIFKLVATGVVEEDKYTTLSEKVRVWGESPNLRAGMFIPDASKGNKFSEFVDKVLDFAKKHEDKQLSEYSRGVVADWSQGSFLHDVRTKLGLIKEKETKAEIVVLRKDSYEMERALGYSSLYFTNFDTGLRRIYLSNDLVSFEHEYAHTQSKGLNRWYMVQLFRGLNEAVTEHAVKDPTSYVSQRIFLRKFLAKDPSFKGLVYSAYMGGDQERVKLFKEIIKGWGLTGFIKFARMSPIDNPHMSGTGKNIFLDPFRARVELGLE